MCPPSSYSSSPFVAPPLPRSWRRPCTVSKETGLSGVKLPKVSVPTFDGKVLNWKSFWEQFEATIYCKTWLNNTEKLMYKYLQGALKNSLARFVIQGLTWTSESYEKAITCLKEWYDRPRLFQEEHICSIVAAVPVKNSSDKELRRLYDDATQHYWALKAAKNDLFETVLAVILQQKLDERHSWSGRSLTSMRDISSVSHTAPKQAWGSDWKLPVKQSYALSTDVTYLEVRPPDTHL